MVSPLINLFPFRKDKCVVDNSSYISVIWDNFTMILHGKNPEMLRRKAEMSSASYWEGWIELWLER